MVKKRILWLDNLKLFAIFLMVLGHCLLAFHFPDYDNNYQNSLCMFIYSFHMPLFMVVSGYFSNKLLKRQTEVKKRFIQLILPCISFTIICYAIGIFSQNFWYLKSLFCCYVIYSSLCVLPFSWKIRHLLVAGGLLLFAPLLIHIHYLDVCKIDFMLPYFALGLVISKNKDYLSAYYKYATIFSAICFAVMLYFWDWQYIWYFSKPSWIDYRNLYHSHSLTFDVDSLLFFSVRLVTGAIGSLFFFSLFGWLNNAFSVAKRTNARIGSLGKYTLHIYLIQSILFSLIEKYIKINVTDINLYTYLVAPVMALTITVLCILVAYSLNQVPFLRFILFGDYSYLRSK